MGKEDEARRQRVRSLLIENKCYMSAHIWFNDPFDSKALLSLNGSDAGDVRKYFDDIFVHLSSRLNSDNSEAFLEKIGRDPVLKEMGGTDKDTIKKCIDMYWAGINEMLLTEFAVDSPVLWKMIADAKTLVAGQMEKTGFLCLTRKQNNILMWSHYADSHKGLCIQFDKTVMDNLEEASLVPVQYDDQYPTLKELMTDRYRQNWAEFFLTKKSSAWKYEEEIRLIGVAEGGIEQIKSIPLELPVGAITGVILGCQMLEDDKETVRCWASRGKQPIRIFEARLKSDEYGVDIEGIDW